jgi:hypothetical protein
MKSSDHRGFRDRRDQAILHRGCRRNTQLVTIHAALAENKRLDCAVPGAIVANFAHGILVMIPEMIQSKFLSESALH